MFELCALGATCAVAALLFRDERTTGPQSAALAVAIGVATVPTVARALAPRVSPLQANLVTGALLSALAVATYPIGGLALLIAPFFLVFGLLGHVRRDEALVPQRRRTLAGSVLLVGPLLVLASLFDPGGAAIVVVPVSIPLFVWAAAVLLRG
jgi:hypothetical protein